MRDPYELGMYPGYWIRFLGSRHREPACMRMVAYYGRAGIDLDETFIWGPTGGYVGVFMTTIEVAPY